jgi:hypothetical protein
LPVVPATRFALLLPTPQNPYGAGDPIPEDHALKGAAAANTYIRVPVVTA